MLSVREALEAILGEVGRLGHERVSLTGAVGRVLAEDVRSLRDVPGYANSAMDGYAVRHADVAKPGARLEVVGVSAAGGPPAPRCGPGQAVKIMTGAPIPQGADAVVRVEDTRADGDSIIVTAEFKPGAHVRHSGEDVRAGEVVMRRGQPLSPADVGLLASVGRALVLVHQRARVSILSTGNELVEPDEAITPGQVVNSNAYTLAAAVAEAGAIPLMLPIARDEPDQIRAAFAEAARHDAILSTGGVSVGDFDYVKSALDELGVRRLFWKVAQKPGKPLTFGSLAGKPYFGLPGNPVSSLVCFYLYARPALRKMMGFAALHLPSVKATLAEDLKKAEGLTEFIRCRIERRGGEWIASSAGSQSSGVLSSMSRGQGLVVGVSDETSLGAGSQVRVVLLGADASVEEAPF